MYLSSVRCRCDHSLNMPLRGLVFITHELQAYAE